MLKKKMFSMRLSVILGLAIFVSACSCSAIQQPERIVPAINKIDRYAIVGLFPYEMTWVQRSDEPAPLVDFEDMNGWTAETYEGASAELRRSREQQLWGHYVAKLTYSGESKNSHVIIRPPKPIRIPGSFDCINMWCFGNICHYVYDPTQVGIFILVRDASDKEFRIALAQVRWIQWWLIHRKVPADIMKQLHYPCYFSGIEVTHLGNKNPRHLYFDSIAFYKEELKPLKFKPRPRRNLKPWRGQIIGTNTGPGTLPFPTREETILPSNYEKKFRTTVKQIGANRYLFEYQGSDTRIVYEYAPAKGSLSEITVKANKENFRPMDGGGVWFGDTPVGIIPAGNLEESNLIRDVVSAKFKIGDHIVEYSLRLWQKSLVIDVWCSGGGAAELVFGKVTGTQNPKLITVPYITYGKSNPRVLMSDLNGKPLFTSIWWDWYRTNASKPFVKPKIDEHRAAEINGGLRYNPKTNGQRNNMYERVFLTVSLMYEEVLPTIANPPAIGGRKAAERIWTVTGPEDWRKDHARCRKIRSYGIDKVMQHSHAVTWREDEGESFTLRLRASPQKGGDAMLKWYNAAQHSLGWRQGMYTNYSDLCPLNTHFSEAGVRRSPNGEWPRAWALNYGMKPSKGVEWDIELAKQIQAKFNSDFSYTDTTTAVPPWSCDYDARVPGAGTMAATFYAYGEILLNDQKVYGIAVSEGTYQWMYAGLPTGNYGWCYTNYNLLEEPLNVAFDLLKMHPLEANYGLGYFDYYPSRLDPNWTKPDKRDWYADRVMASAIAYGHNGFLYGHTAESPLEVSAMARSYYMMQQLQQRYCMIPPRKIEYADMLGKMISVSEALATDVIRESRVHVIYENGLEIFVNGNGSSTSSNKNWLFRAPDGKQVELPPAGWYVYDPVTKLREISGLISGHRVDYVISPEYEFLDGRGQWTEMGNLAVAGSVVMRPQKGDSLEFIDIYGNERIVFKANANGRMTAYDEEGKSLGNVPVKLVRDGYYELQPVPEGRRYVFTPKS